MSVPLRADAAVHAHIPADPLAGLGAAYVVRGDARAIPMDDESVDMVVTSPPYFALRSYRDGGEHYAGQIGDEPTPAEFVDSLIAVTQECMRVLRPTGSLWVNLGDKYTSNSNGSTGHRASSPDLTAAPRGRGDRFGMPVKSLMGLPWRYALRCVDDLGLILRAEVVWSKPNGMPESVIDRVRRSHETWFHFVRQPRYFSAVDEIREGYAPSTAARYASGYASAGRPVGTFNNGPMRSAASGDGGPAAVNPLGKLPGSVWTIATEPLIIPDEVAHARCCGGKPHAGCEDGLAHYAAFPTEWPARLIRAWAPLVGVCVACGEGLRPAVTTDLGAKERAVPVYGGGRHGGSGPSATITGYACGCSEASGATRPAVILDPCGGTGTTAMAARALGAAGVTLDLSQDYCRLAEWRIRDSGGEYRMRGIDKPATPHARGQLPLFVEDVTA